MQEHVLAVTRPVLQPAQKLDDIRRQARDARVVGGLLASLADDDVHLGPSLGNDFFDSAGMNAAVTHELHQGHASDLAAHGIEPGQDNGLGCVIDDQIDTGRLLQGPDVPTFATDDPPLHLVVRQMDNGDRVLGCVVRRDTLHRRDDDVARLFVGLLARAALDGPGDLDGVVFGLFPDGFGQHALGVFD